MEKFEVIQLSSLDIADLLQADHIGPEVIIERVSSLKKLRPNSLVWSKASNVDQLLNFGKQNPIFAIVPMQTELTGISGVCVTQPRDSFSKCLKSFFCAGLEGVLLARQHCLTFVVNASNISDLSGKKFNTVVCAAAPGSLRPNFLDRCVRRLRGW